MTSLPDSMTRVLLRHLDVTACLVKIPWSGHKVAVSQVLMERLVVQAAVGRMLRTFEEHREGTPAKAVRAEQEEEAGAKYNTLEANICEGVTETRAVLLRGEALLVEDGRLVPVTLRVTHLGTDTDTDTLHTRYLLLTWSHTGEERVDWTKTRKDTKITKLMLRPNSVTEMYWLPEFQGRMSGHNKTLQIQFVVDDCANFASVCGALSCENTMQ